MRIAIDFSAVRITSTIVYCNGFMPALARLAPQDDFFVFMSPEVAELLAGRLPPNFQQQIVTVSKNMTLRILWEQCILPRRLQTWQADVLFAPFDIAPIVAPCPVLLAVRNPTALLLSTALVGSKIDRFKGYFHQALTSLSCWKAQCVFYPTAYAARRLGDRIAVPLNKRAIVHHGTDAHIWSTPQEPTATLKQYGIEKRRFLLFVSQAYPHKRPDVLIEGFAVWRRKNGRADYQLVLVGGSPVPAFAQKLRQRVQELGLEKVILFLGHVPGEHLPVLYQQAAVFVFPTEMETFGHPFVEAMACGAPVVCADTEFARELCGDAARYFSPGDAGQLAQILDQVISQPDLSAQMIAAGRERAQAFGWEREARETLTLMRKVGNGQVGTEDARASL